jgi:CysZ protein
MLDAAIKALGQMLTPPFRSVLWKSIGLAILILILLGVGLGRLSTWLAAEGQQYLDGVVGMTWQTPLHWLLWMITIALGVGLLLGAVFLMPAVTALVASFFTDEIADLVEREHYPADPPGKPLPVARAAYEGIKAALLAMLIYLCAVPFLLFAGIGVVVFFVATAWLLGREYFLLVAMRHHPPDEAKAIRRARHGTLFVAGMFIAGFVSIPIVNLATPLFGTAFMVHMHKRIAGGPRRELIEPLR